MTDSTALRRAEALRHFNRFYTQHISALHERLQKSAFSLTEVRVLYELTRGQAQTAAALALLQWQIEMGADEAIGDVALNRLAPPPSPKPFKTQTQPTSWRVAELC